MTTREAIQIRLTGLLESNHHIFNAPYGVIASFVTFPRGGKARTITFGIARDLDAEIIIMSPSRISINARGPAMRLFHGNYKSELEVTRLIQNYVDKCNPRAKIAP